MREPGTTRKQMFWNSSAFKIIYKKRQKYSISILGPLKTLNYAFNLNVKINLIFCIFKILLKYKLNYLTLKSH